MAGTADTNWETDQVEEVFLGNYGEEGYLEGITILVQNPDRDDAIVALRQYIEQGNASSDFYDGWNQPPASSYESVDWNHVYELCDENAKGNGDIE